MASMLGGMNLTGVASSDLGLGGQLSQQVKDETEEERKKRMLGMSATQSPAAQMLLGGGLGGRAY